MGVERSEGKKLEKAVVSRTAGFATADHDSPWTWDSTFISLIGGSESQIWPEVSEAASDFVWAIVFDNSIATRFPTKSGRGQPHSTTLAR